MTQPMIQNAMPPSPRHSILIVDDEPQIRDILTEFLTDEYTVYEAGNGIEAVEQASAKMPDLILMDLNMPKLDGIQACQLLRTDEKTRAIPILFLTAYNTPERRIQAFDFGADDFIPKPFQPDELLSRLRNKFRRIEEIKRGPLPSRTKVGNLTLDVRNRKTQIDQDFIELTPIEFDLLQLLATQEGQLVSRDEIIANVWKGESVHNRIIDTHMSLLRKKIRSFSGEIRSVYGLGYLLDHSRRE